MLLRVVVEISRHKLQAVIYALDRYDSKLIN